MLLPNAKGVSTNNNIPSAYKRPKSKQRYVILGSQTWAFGVIFRTRKSIAGTIRIFPELIQIKCETVH